MRFTLLLTLCLISYMNWAQTYTQVKYNKCAIRQPEDSDYNIMNLSTKFEIFSDGGTSLYIHTTNDGSEKYEILSDILPNYIENYKYYEFLAMNTGFSIVKIRYFPDSRENGIYFVFDDGTNIQFFYEE